MVDLDVVIAAYNGAATIQAAVRSAIAVPGARVIVVDDGSTDGTAELARQAGATVISQANSGASNARARGTSESNAEFVIYLDADDRIVVQGALACLSRLESNPDAAVCAGRVRGFVSGGNPMLLRRHYSEVTPRTLVATGFGPWPPASAVMRRSALERASRLEPLALRTRYAEDYEQIIRLSMVGAVLFEEEVSAEYLLFGGKSSISAVQALSDKEKIRAYYADFLGVQIKRMSERDIRAAARIKVVRGAWARAQRTRALLNFAAVLVAHPIFVFRKVIQ